MDDFRSGEDEDPAPHSPAFEGPVGFGRLGEVEGRADSAAQRMMASHIAPSMIAISAHGPAKFENDSPPQPSWSSSVRTAPMKATCRRM